MVRILNTDTQQEQNEVPPLPLAQPLRHSIVSTFKIELPLK